MGMLGGLASLVPQLPAGYETYRRMRRDPTIALARALAIAPVVAGKWTVEADADVSEGIRGWIDKQFLTVREPLLETILQHGYVNFGHQGFELVWGLDAQGRQCIVRFKPLLPDITEILIDEHGSLAGLRQRKVDLLGASAMLVSFGGEGSSLYGEPLLENVREVWNDWRKANEVAARYDRKIAGAYLLLHYPSFGQGIDQNGAKLDNVYLAQRILDKLEAASGVAVGDVPSELAPGQDPNQTAWRLEVQGSAGGQQQGFVDRLRYLDSLKVRGMLLPERAILEGQHGTLAESQSQGDLACLQAELVHHHVTREINRQAVDPVLEANWGPAYRGKVRLAAAPLSSDNLGFLRQLVPQVLSDPKDFAELFHRADWPSIFDAVGLPQIKIASPASLNPSAILSAIRRLQHELTEKSETPTQPPTRQEGHSTTGAPSEGIAFEPQDAHIESDVTDALHLANFNPHEPRDDQGRWTKVGAEAGDDGSDAAQVGSDAGPSATTPDKHTLRRRRSGAAAHPRNRQSHRSGRTTPADPGSRSATRPAVKPRKPASAEDSTLAEAPYRKNFVAVTPYMPGDWQVHHVDQKILVDRLRNELGVDVHHLPNLRAVPEEIHKEISTIQNKFWADKIRKYGNRADAYANTPMSEIRRLNQEIENVYRKFMVPAQATEAEFAAVERLLQDKRVVSVGRASRIKTVLERAGVALGALAIFGVLLDNAALAKNIASPSPQVKHELDELLDAYAAAYDEALSTGQVSRRRWALLGEDLQRYMAAAGFNDSAKAIVAKYFVEQEQKLPY